MPESQLPHVGDVIAAQVTRVVPFGAFVEITSGVPGLMVTDDPPAAGARLDVRVDTVDHRRRRVSVTAV